MGNGRINSSILIMNKILKTIGYVLLALILSTGAVKAVSLFQVQQGGTGVGTLTGLAKGNGTSAFTVAVPGTDYAGLSSTNSFSGANTFTTANQTNIGNLDTTLYADQFSGADICAQVNTAYAALPTNGGTIMLPAGTFTCTTPIVFGTNNKFITLRGAGAASTYIQFTPTSGTAITINTGNPTGHLIQEITGFTLMGKTSLVAAAQTNTNTSVGIFYGGANGAVGINTHDFNINGFGTNWQIGSNAYMLSFDHFSNSGGNGGQAATGALLHINVASNSGERNVFSNGSFTDPGNSSATNCIYISNGATASNFFSNISKDDCQARTGASDGIQSWDKIHEENAAFNTYGNYVPYVSPSSDMSTLLSFTNYVIANDTSGANSFSTIFSVGGPVNVNNVSIQNYGGGTIAALVDHSTDNGVSHDHVCQVQVQGGTLTNIIAGSGGVAWSRATGGGCVDNTDNSYTIGLQANGSNTNNFFSGSTNVGTFDHSGNWVLGANSSSTTTLNGLTTNGLVKTSGGTGLLGIATAGTDYQAPLTLTTTGTSGAATLISNTLNIPQYTGGGGSGLVVGTTTITSGTSGRVEYNNAGVLGEMTTTGTGTVLALATGPTFTTPILGAATGTSLGLGGATVSDALDVTGSIYTSQYLGVNVPISTIVGNTWTAAIQSPAGTQNVVSLLRPTNTVSTLLQFVPTGGFSVSNVAWFMGMFANSDSFTFGNYNGGSSVTYFTISDTGVVNIPQLTASSAVATDSSKNLISVANTGTGNNVLATSPTLVTPILGAATGTSLVLTNTGGAQLNLNYDGTHVSSFTVNSAGDLSITQTGQMNLGTTNRTFSIVDAATTSGFYQYNSGSGTANAVGMTVAGTWNASSGINVITSINPTITQTGTAGFTAFKVNPTISTSGSGAQLSADFQGGGVSHVNISVAGALTIQNNITTAAWTTNGTQLSVAAATLSDNTSAAGTVTTQVANAFGIPTFTTPTNAVTYTNGATVYIAGAPVNGTNVTITNKYALMVSGGNISLGNGAISTGSLTSSGTGSFATGLGTAISGTADFFAASASGIGGTNTTSTIQFAGSSNVQFRGVFNGNTSTTLSTVNNYGNVIIGASPVTLFSSGVHAMLANTVIKALGTVTPSGTSTVTNTASLYVDGQSAATVTGGNYALLVNGGTTLVGGFGTAIATVTATTNTLTLVQSTVLCDATTGNQTDTLPTAASAYNTLTGEGGIIALKKIDSSANTCTLKGNGAETIDGVNTKVESSQYTGYRVQSNGTSWFVLP